MTEEGLVKMPTEINRGRWVYLHGISPEMIPDTPSSNMEVRVSAGNHMDCKTLCPFACLEPIILSTPVTTLFFSAAVTDIVGGRNDSCYVVDL